MKTLRVILGDQLSHSISSLSDHEDGDIILMMEVWDEATYVKHHKKKIAFLFSAMRHFADELREKGYDIHYTKLDDPDNAGSFYAEVERAVKAHKPDDIVVTYPGEYRVLKSIEQWESAFGVSVEIRPDDRFMCSIPAFEDWAEGRKQARMEYFYREMRRNHNILMDGDKPEGGEWNYDSQNRQTPKELIKELSSSGSTGGSSNQREQDPPIKSEGDTGFKGIPKPYNGPIDDITREVMDLIADRFDNHFGDLEPFYFAVTRDQALYVLDKFIAERLDNFGDFQDAMVEGEPWMYHSHISFYLNCGLLLPEECIRKAEDAYYDSRAPLNAVEGFIRQILGWREFIRGIYWLKMPDYAEQNFLEAKRDLPAFYWTAETDMNCLKQCVSETKENAYAHHIQRLMVLGNFALLAGIEPAQVNEWFLIVYADAYEWVELPNVSGMILFADGGYLGSKPYAAGGSYINKMSNYCKNCKYSVKEKNGENACPFNYLYWNFLIENEDKLRGNPRLNMIYAGKDKMDDEKIKAISDDSKNFFAKIGI